MRYYFYYDYFICVFVVFCGFGFIVGDLFARCVYNIHSII